MLKNALHTFKLSDQGGSDSEQIDRTTDRIGVGAPDQGESEPDDSTGAPVEASTDEAPEVGLDEVFGLLRNQRRRDVLWYLQGTDEQVAIGKLAKAIAARECDKSVSQVTSQERKRVYIGLYQGHLPKMDDCGAVAYNQDRGVLDEGPNFDVFVAYLPDDEEGFGASNDSCGLLQRLVNFILSHAVDDGLQKLAGR